MAELRIGVLGAANIARKVVIPSILRADGVGSWRSGASRAAGRTSWRERAARRRARLPVRGAPRGPGGRRRLHPAPEPPARGVVDARRRRRQARAVREAGRAAPRPRRKRRSSTASRRGVVWMEAFMYRFHPQWKLVFERLAGRRDRRAAHRALDLHVHGPRPAERPAATGARRRLALRRRLLLRQRRALAASGASRSPWPRRHARSGPRASTRSSRACSTSATGAARSSQAASASRTDTRSNSSAPRDASWSRKRS